MDLLIPVAAGVEASVKRQLNTLGYGDCPAINGRISLAGSFFDVARLNVFLRSGERVLIELGSLPAETFNELYDGAFSLPWEEFLSPHSLIRMDGKSYKSKLGAVKAAGGVVKKAIVARLREKLGVRTLDEKGERAVVGVSIFGDVASFTLDTSGEGLHKRGYRTLAYDAPLKETVAAAMIESSVYRAGKPFADLFCGSGTIPIEAALYALNIAPNAERTFDFTQWKCAPKDALSMARQEAEDVRDRNTKLSLLASDISANALSIARYHAKRAGVAEHIRFSCADMREFSSEERYGVLLSNPPYGERLKESDLFSLYRDFGRMYRALPDWSCYFLSGYAEAERAFGGRAQKRRKLYNANISCGFYGYLGAKPPKNK